MKSMEHDSDLLNELQRQKSELIQELFTLQRKLKGITYMSYFADEYSYISIICCSVAKLLCPTLCDPMDSSTLGPPILPLNSCSLSQWCYLSISSSAAPFSFCLQSFPASGSFPMSQFLSGGQSIEVSSSASVIPVNIQGWFHLGLTGLILQSKRLFKRLLQYHSSKASILQRSTFFMVHLSHPYMATGKTIALTIQIFVGKVMSLLFNMRSRLVIAFLPRSIF